MNQKKIKISNIDPLLLVGPHDEFLKLVELKTGCQAILRHETLTVTGADNNFEKAVQIFQELIFLLHRNGKMTRADVDTVIDLASIENEMSQEYTSEKSPVILKTKRCVIRPKTSGQEAYIKAVRQNDIVFCVGPAGTGKTYLAVAIAVAALQTNQVSKIVLTRPAIEAGENLGFLPGDLMEKVDPYLRPLTDALFDMMPSDQLQRHMDRKIIEIIPLGYMRGRTLNNAFIILDEAQNTSPMQMKMLLTRLGINSKAIITGDITQIDLPEQIQSGLVQIRSILNKINNITFVYLDKKDVVRHRLVRDIIQAYETYHSSQNGDAT